ncbi:hypothetical protein VMCG_10440 [Cytospora schulzeri]|uniref:NB-ARC domain-containing protein n=1 Tax=Cytospora schulzeri TaxID=448051 RepID=A0A423VB19_9PEZI|nr:hypothetical protein VMCG_10440 [Valsa malicola]
MQSALVVVRTGLGGSDTASRRSISSKDLGLKVLVEPKEPDGTEVDIVAVHGIGAPPTKTWVYSEKDDKGQKIREVNWLADNTMLPSAVKDARIMTFNYDSVWFGDAPTRQTLDGVATTLLREIKKKRRDCGTRPIILIGHCFGGLVMQKAYALSKLNSHDFPGIYKSITGMLFLGTPFQGSVALQSQGKLFDIIVRTQHHVQENIIHTLAYNNDELVATVFNFTRDINIRRSAAPELFCFYEQRATNVGAIVGMETTPEFVVDETSGTLSCAQKQGMPLDHFRMNKFEGEQDNNYECVRDQIIDMRDKSAEVLEARLKIDNPSSSSTAASQSMPSSTLPFKREPNFAPRGGIMDLINEKFDRNVKVAMCGDSGSGKTQIAIEYAHTFHGAYPESKVLWVNASSAEEFELSYKLIAQSLHLRLDTGTSVLQAVRHFLKQDSSGHWLLVIDGVDNDKQLKATSSSDTGKSLLDFIPVGLHGRVLFTTRSFSLAGSLAGHEYVVELPKLDDENAAQLWLGKATHDAGKKRSAVEVAKAVGGSPTALVMARAYRQAVGQVSTRKYLSLLQSLGPPSKGVKDSDAGVYQAWKLLYNDLKNKSPEAANLMLLAGILDLQSLRYFFLAKATESRSQADKQLECLKTYGMVEPSNNRVTIGVTAAIRRCVRSWLIEEGKSDWAEEWALKLMCKSYPDPDDKEWETCEIMNPSALAVLKFKPSSTDAKRNRAILLFRVGSYHLHISQPKTATRHIKEALRYLEEEPEKNDALISKAKAALKKARETSSSEAGQNVGDRTGKDSDTRSLWNSALRDGLLQRLKKSEVKDWEKNDVSDISQVAAELLKKPGTVSDDPVALYKQVTSWCTERYGKDDIDTVRQQYNLGLALDRKGQYKEAAEVYTETSRLAERLLGPGHPELLRILGSVARMHCAADNPIEASKTMQIVLEGQTKTLGLSHPHTLLTRQNAAILAQEQGHFKEAEEELSRVLRAQVQLLGADDPACLNTMCSLALNYRLQGRSTEAKELYKTTMERQTRILGKGHPDTATTATMLDELRDEILKRREAGYNSVA